MLVVSQNRSNVVNIDNIDGFHVDYNGFQDTYTIVARFKRPTIALGQYKNEDRARQILKEIIDNYATSSRVYYIPKDRR